MDDFESLSHSKWECKYHVVFIPKDRRKALYVELRQHLGDVFRKLAEQKESRIEEGHLLSDHVHMLISIPPKYAVSQMIGFIKGKSAIDQGADPHQRRPILEPLRSGARLSSIWIDAAGAIQAPRREVVSGRYFSCARGSTPLRVE
jgi:REP element-mobilizing transposase RayT